MHIMEMLEHLIFILPEYILCHFPFIKTKQNKQQQQTNSTRPSTSQARAAAETSSLTACILLHGINERRHNYLKELNTFMAVNLVE